MDTIGNILLVAQSAWIDRRPKPREVSEQRLQYAAVQMAKSGYVHTRESILALRAYLQGYGVLLAGEVGIGKTMFFSCVNPDIIVLNMNDAARWKYDELRDWLDSCREEEVLVDDIGAVDSIGKDYGKDYDTLLVILERRLRASKRTHFTTNRTNDELIKILDYRVVDRIYGLAKCFTLPADDSKREPTAYNS